MSRSKWKGPYFKKDLLKLNPSGVDIARNSIISAGYLGKFINIYTGKEYKKVFISNEKIGLKFGSFAYTRRGKIKPKTINKKK